MSCIIKQCMENQGEHLMDIIFQTSTIPSQTSFVSSKMTKIYFWPCTQCSNCFKTSEGDVLLCIMEQCMENQGRHLTDIIFEIKPCHFKIHATVYFPTLPKYNFIQALFGYDSYNLSVGDALYYGTECEKSGRILFCKTLWNCLCSKKMKI